MPRRAKSYTSPHNTLEHRSPGPKMRVPELGATSSSTYFFFFSVTDCVRSCQNVPRGAAENISQIGGVVKKKKKQKNYFGRTAPPNFFFSGPELCSGRKKNRCL
jgi:hypothetical protein